MRFSTAASLLSIFAAIVVSGDHKMSDIQTDFALRLLEKVGSDGESTFFSPFSISAALAMLLAGASGATKSQLQEKIFGGRFFFRQNL
jgi:serine protease inhibitor